MAFFIYSLLVLLAVGSEEVGRADFGRDLRPVKLLLADVLLPLDHTIGLIDGHIALVDGLLESCVGCSLRVNVMAEAAEA